MSSLENHSDEFLEVVLSRTQSELAETRTRLQLYKNVCNAELSDLPLDRIIENALTATHKYFPSFRISYCTADAEGVVTVTHSVASRQMPSIGGLKIIFALTPELLQDLQSGKLVVLTDAPNDRRSQGLADVFRKIGTGSSLMVPVRNPQHDCTFVSYGAKEARQWTAYELAVLSDMAEYLAITIRQAQSQADKSRMEEHLRENQKVEAVGRLVGGIAHDFNNLLTAMMIYCGLLSTSLGKAHRLHGHVEQIRQAGERGANLVAQLLALTKQQVLEPRIVSIGAVVEDMRDLLQKMIGEDIVLLTGCAEQLHNTKVDESQLQQVILNMAINARDAMPGGGQLSLECANVRLDEKESKEYQLPPGEYVQLSISDNGQGMDASTKAQIFDPFFTTKGQGKGTGLGLSTAYGIIKQHGGSILVNSTPNEGTSFTILFPATAGAPEVPTSIGEERLHRNKTLRRETLLLVEDEEMVRRSLVEILRLDGYNVLEAEDGSAALKISDSHSGEIQLMITDLVMPGMNGRQVADAMGPRRPNMAVLFISGYSDDPRTRAMLGEGVDFFRKPFSMEALSKKVRQILDREKISGTTSGDGPIETKDPLENAPAISILKKGFAR